MILNAEHYRYAGRRKKKRGWLVFVLVAVVAAAGVLLWRLELLPWLGRRLKADGHSEPLSVLWTNRRYDELIARCDALLAADPLDWYTLSYRGFACFYKAVAGVNQEERIPYLDEAIVSLRRARLAPAGSWTVEGEYVLGKAYYHKGKYYYDLTIEYLQRALEAGYTGEDIYDYLGLAATQLDRVEEGLSYFRQAMEINPTDLLLLSMGQSYLQLGRVAEAEEYLIRAVNKTEDQAVEKKSRYLLGQLYFERQDLIKAEGQYDKILDLDPDAADAHYYLGEIYLKMNDPVRARSEWRKALIIDPSHYGARLRYYR
jgi:tetratricopeptide (TPR) repeat protein